MHNNGEFLSYDEFENAYDVKTNFVSISRIKAGNKAICKNTHNNKFLHKTALTNAACKYTHSNIIKEGRKRFYTILNQNLDKPTSPYK